MSATWGVVGTSPFQDYDVDLEDLVYKYIGTNWSITTPSHLNKETIFMTTDPAQMKNRPDPGNKQTWLWVAQFDLDTGRELPGSTIGKHGHIPHFHTLNLNLMSMRLSQGLLFPDMGIMARELERLMYQYNKGDILGIDHFDHFKMLQMVEASTLGPGWESYAGTFIATCRITAHYWKQRLD